MNRKTTCTTRALLILLPAMAALSGCGLRSTPLVAPGELLHYQNVAMDLETPNLKPCPDDPALSTMSPDVINEKGPVVYWDMKLCEAMQTALARSKVMHDLGGAELRNPELVRTISDPALTDTDPRFGVESALADYDAVFNASADSQHNHRALNNIFFGGGTRILIQDLDTFKEEIVKETPTGTEFTFRHNTVYDNNNEPGNLFPSAWDTNFEAEVRQHLLQGGGLEYNRIAGPHGSPGQMNGVLIARINTDVALTDFEMGIRDLASNVENAYWDLYFAYRDLDANVLARDNALESWRRIHALNLTGRRGGEAEKEAQARQQYFQFQEAVENAWNGRLIDGTHTDNGSGGGTFRGAGVRVAERRLRRLLGLPISDGRLIRPADEPALAKMVFCWNEILPEALTRRPELRRQRWMVKRRELELIASRNFLLPTLDVTGLYRFRGFGHDLIDTDRSQAEFDSAYGDLGTGMFQEWELGAQFSMPIGERKGHTAVRNAQLSLARERAILDDQEQEVVHDLSNALAEVDRAYAVAQTAFNRRIAARSEVAATQAAFESDNVPLDTLLEAQRRQADAESGFFSALVEYALAIKNLHYAKGSLLDYNEIYLAEGPWPKSAYDDAAKIKQRKHELLDYRMKPAPVSLGPIPQPAAEVPMSGPPGPNMPSEPMENIPPGVEMRPLPSMEAPQMNSLPPMPKVEGESSTSMAPLTPQPLVPARISAPQQSRQSPARMDFSSSSTPQNSDLQPRTQHVSGPVVEAAKIRPIGMEELISSQPPPAALPEDNKPTSDSSADVVKPIAERSNTDEPAERPVAGEAAAFSPTAAGGSSSSTDVETPRRSEDANTLSIFSRRVAQAQARDNSANDEVSQLRIVSQPTAPTMANSATPAASSNVTDVAPAAPGVRSAAANKSDLPTANRGSWPESTVQPSVPVNRIDDTSPSAPSGEHSIWTRGPVQPASYSDMSANKTAQPFQPLPPMGKLDNAPASPQTINGAPQNALSPLPPAANTGAQDAFQSRNSTSGTANDSTLKLVQPSVPAISPPAQNSIQPLPPIAQ